MYFYYEIIINLSFLPYYELVIIKKKRIKKTLSLQGSIMSELMRHTIDQSTIVVKACSTRVSKNLF